MEGEVKKYQIIYADPPWKFGNMDFGIKAKILSAMLLTIMK